MIDFDTIVAVAKVIWPVAAWVALVNQRLKKLEHDVDYLYWKLRGGKAGAMRQRSIGSRIKRLKHEVRKRIHGGKNPSGTA